MRNKTVYAFLVEHYEKWLIECVRENDGRAVTAGEFGKWCGVSRSQAKMRLSQLVACQRANRVVGTHTNKQPMTRYYPSRECQHIHTWVTETSTGEIFWTCRDCGEING